MLKDDLYERGLSIRREMFGSKQADGQVGAVSDFDEKLQEIVTRNCYGDIWARDGLDRRERSLLTLAFLVALGQTDELEFHLEGAIANGATVVEIRELLLQATVYCGLPAAYSGFRVAQRVLNIDEGEH